MACARLSSKNQKKDWFDTSARLNQGGWLVQDCLKKDWSDTLLPIWPSGAPVAGTNAGVGREISCTMGSFAGGGAGGTFVQEVQEGVLYKIFWKGEGWWRSPNPGTVGGTGLLVGEKVPPRYSCVCVSQSGATLQLFTACVSIQGAGVLLAYQGAGVSAKMEEVAAPGCQVHCRSSDSVTRGRAEKCSSSAGKLFYAGRWVGGLGRRGAGQCPVRPHPPDGHHAKTQTLLAKRKCEIKIVGTTWDIRPNRRKRGCDVEGKDTIQLGDISGPVMAWTKCCYLHTR